MVNVSYKRNENIFELSIYGHAGYAQAGADICCAGISALVIALDKWIDDNKHVLQYAPVRQIQNGSALFYLRVKSKYAKQVKTAFDMCYAGLAWLAKAYPANIRTQ